MRETCTSGSEGERPGKRLFLPLSNTPLTSNLIFLVLFILLPPIRAAPLGRFDLFMLLAAAAGAGADPTDLAIFQPFPPSLPVAAGGATVFVSR